MKIVIQRVRAAKVEVEGEDVAQIKKGMLVYIGAAVGDNFWDAQYIAEKLINLRIFEDDKGKMNLNVSDISGQILLISNFTLCANCRKGRRPGFDEAADPQSAKALIEEVSKLITAAGVNVKNGVFAAHMHVTSTNDGPVTFTLDSRQEK